MRQSSQFALKQHSASTICHKPLSGKKLNKERLKMKRKQCLWTLIVVLCSSMAFGAESLNEIGLDKATKSQAVRELRASIKRHESMNVEELVNDLKSNISKNVAELARHQITVNPDAVENRLKD